jgi:hypothetical protein
MRLTGHLGVRLKREKPMLFASSEESNKLLPGVTLLFRSREEIRIEGGFS